MHNAALAVDGTLAVVQEAQQWTHDALYEGSDAGRLMRRPPGVHWTYHRGADIAAAARLVYDHPDDPEAQGVLAAVLTAAASAPLSVLVVGHAIVRRVDPTLN